MCCSGSPSLGLNVRVERLAGNDRFQAMAAKYARQKSVSSDFSYPPWRIPRILLGGCYNILMGGYDHVYVTIVPIHIGG
jgi:hypothetical protein